MMKKKTACVLALVSLAAIGIGAVATTTTMSTMHNLIATTNYSKTWTEAPKLESGKMILNGVEGGVIEVGATNKAEKTNGIITIRQGGTFFNVTAIGSIKKIIVEYKKGETLYTPTNPGSDILDLTYGFKKSANDDTKNMVERIKFKNTIDFTKIMSLPSYFEFLNISDGDVTITKLTVEYGCKTHDTTKVNHYEFELSEIEGNSRESGPTPHLCPARTYINPNLDGNVALDVMDAAKYTFKIEAAEAVKAPIRIHADNYYLQQKTGTHIKLTVNGDAKKANLDFDVLTRPTAPNWDDEWPGQAGYHNMVDALGTIDLVKGLNTITFDCGEWEWFLDSFEIRTDVKLTNKTVPTLSGEHAPEFKVITFPTETQPGAIARYCHCINNCDKDGRLAYIPPLGLETSNYEYEEVNGKKVYFMTLFGQRIYLSEKQKAHETVLEFENASFKGVTKPNNEHYCAKESFRFAPEFSGHIICENTIEKGTTYEFTVNAEAAERIKFGIDYSAVYIPGDAKNSTYFDVKVNNLADDETKDAPLNKNVKYVPTYCDGVEFYFNMMEAQGMINLTKGTNVITVTVKNFANIDCLRLKSDTVITDETVSSLNKEGQPVCTVTKAPTPTEKGEVTVKCYENGTHGDNKTDPTKKFAIPELSHEIYTQRGGHYYITLVGQELKVA